MHTFYLLIEYKKQSILFSSFTQNGSLEEHCDFFNLGFTLIFLPLHPLKQSSTENSRISDPVVRPHS